MMRLNARSTDFRWPYMPTSPWKSTKSSRSAVPEYFSIERPSRTGWRPISRAYSTRVFTRAMWEENVVATIPPE